MHSSRQDLRREEIEVVRGWLKPGMRVLEIGGDNGYQASLMSDLGCMVLSIDLAHREAPPSLFHPVIDYDGRTIPAPDASMDLVFSSNVLEHVRCLPPMFAEIHRVMKPGAVALHILPSSTWRLWTSMAVCGHIARRLFIRRQDDRKEHPTGGGSGTHGVRRLRSAFLLFVAPHGEHGNALSELFYFSRRWWRRVFESNGFEIVHLGTNGLFYTGYHLFPGLMPLTRRRLSRILGAACNIFVMKKRSM